MKLARYRTIILAVIGGCALSLLLALQLGAAMIDTNAAIRPLQKAAEELTGQKLIIEDVSASLIGGLSITVNKVAIRHSVETSQPYFVQADKLVLQLSWSDLFEDAPTPSSMQVFGLKLHFETKEDGGKSWHALSQLGQRVAGIAALSMTLHDASITYNDVQAGDVVALSAMNGQLSLDTQGVKANLSARAMDVPLQLSGNCTVAQFEHLAKYDALCNATLKADGMDTTLSYRLLRAQGDLQLRGTITAQAQDARLWADAATGQQRKLWQQRFIQPISASLKAETFSDRSRFIVNASEFKFGESHGKASYTSAQQGEHEAVKLQLAFEMLDFDALKPLMANRAQAADNTLLSPAVEGSVQVSANQARYNGLEVRQLRAIGAFEKEQITLPQITAQLPANGRLQAMGRVIAVDEGAQFEGSVEASGQSLAALSPLFGFTPTPAAEQLLGQYRTRFNAAINPQSSILSELRLLVNGSLRIAGGMALTRGDLPSLTGSISIENANLAPLWHEWLGQASLLAAPITTPEAPLRFSWISRMKLQSDLLLRIKNIQLPYDTAATGQLRLKLAADSFGLQDIELDVGEMQVSGSSELKVSAASERPQLRATLRFSQLALGNWLRSTTWRQQGEAADASAPSVWSKQPFNFMPLRHMDANLEIDVDQLSHDAFAASNARLVAEVNASVLTIREWVMRVWDGDFRATGALDVRTLPNLSLTARHDNAQLLPLMQTLFGRSNVSGQISLAHSLKTAGVNFYEWMQQLEGGITFESQELVVEELNLARLMQLLASSRSVSEVPNMMRQAEAGGASRFTALKGITYFEGGSLKTTKIQLVANGIAGEISALLDMMQYRMESSIRLAFPALGKGAAQPQLGLRFTGTIDDAQRSLNLTSIESYIAQKAR